MTTGTIYKANGEIVSVSPKNGKDFSCEELQDAVGGHFDIQRLPGSEEYMVLNDDGLSLNLPVNKMASKVWERAYPIEIYPINNTAEIVGDVLVCDRKLIK